MWRCHVGIDTQNAHSEQAWAFLRPYLEGADAWVFSRSQFAPSWMPPNRLAVIPPSIDPFSAKNEMIEPTDVTRLLQHVGLLAGNDAGPAVSFHATRRIAGERHTPGRPARHRPTAAPVDPDRAASLPLGCHEGHARRHDRLRRRPSRDAHRRRSRPRRSRSGRRRRRPRSRRRTRRLPQRLGPVAGGDPAPRSPCVRADERQRRSRHDRERIATTRNRRRAEELRGGLRADRRRGDVEGTPRRRQCRGRHRRSDRRRRDRRARRREQPGPVRPGSVRAARRPRDGEADGCRRAGPA